MAAEAYLAYGEMLSGEERCRSLQRAREVWNAWKADSSPWLDARRAEAAQLVATCLNPR